MTEAEFQTSLIKWARSLGWRVHAERPARTAEGWRTPIAGDKGWPDLVLCRPPRLIFAELKVGKNQPTADQVEWLRDLAMVRGRDDLTPPRNVIETVVWRPEMWSQILVILSRR